MIPVDSGHSCGFWSFLWNLFYSCGFYSIPVDSHPIPVDSTGMTGFRRNDVGHQKVLSNTALKTIRTIRGIQYGTISCHECYAYNVKDDVARKTMEDHGMMM